MKKLNNDEQLILIDRMLKVHDKINSYCTSSRIIEYATTKLSPSNFKDFCDKIMDQRIIAMKKTGGVHCKSCSRKCFAAEFEDARRNSIKALGFNY